MSLQERPYQTEFVMGGSGYPGVVPAWTAGDEAVLGILPTGCGKTVCAGMVATKALADEGRRTLFLAHREELIVQAANTLARFGLEVGIEMGDQSIDTSEALGLFENEKPQVVVATVQTLQRKRLEKRSRTEFGVIMTDEAHHSRAKTYRNIYDYFEGYVHLGITATPDRSDNKNLGAVYSKIAYDYPMRTAIREGYLCNLEVLRLPCDVSLKDIKTTGGDYRQDELEERIGPHIEALCRVVGDLIGDRQTVIFCPDVGSAAAAASVMDQLGKSAKTVSGKTPKAIRKDRLAEFADGGFQVITCCDLLMEGWDCPCAACIVIMRPTKSRSRYAQMIGRGTRPFGTPGEPGHKENCLVLDFAWETTSDHELSTAIDLFDDSSIDDEVSEEATKLIESGAESDPVKAIDRAEEIVSERNILKIRLTGKRTSYQKIVADPVGVGKVLAIPIKRAWDFNPDNPASERQLDFLRKLGIADPSGLSRPGAGKLIELLAKRRDAGLATAKQVAFLVSLGVAPGLARRMKFAEASTTIGQLLQRQVA